MTEDGDWEDGDHLMRCTGLVYTIHYDAAEDRGWVETWSRRGGVAVAITAGAQVLAAYWRSLRAGGACFPPSRTQLRKAGYPEGMA